MTTPDMQLNVLYRSKVCGSINSNQWLTNPNDYQAVSLAISQQMTGDTAPRLPPVNFEKSRALLVSMGQQRTGGYAVNLAKQQLRIDNDAAIVEVQWLEPEPGMMLVQMLSNPCLLIEVPRGEYRKIQVLDQSKHVRASMEVGGH